jgi:hypothetical protein
MNAPLDIRKIWASMDTGTWKGTNQLVKLAVRIFSISGNSADCERLFSKMGDIHSKKRNRLREQRVRDMVVVKMSIQRQHAASAPKKLKRKRSEMEDAPDLAPVPSLREKTPTPIDNSSTSDDDAPAENDSGAVVKELAALARLDDDANVDLTLTENPPPPAILRQLNIEVVPSAGDAPTRRRAD